MHTVKACEHVEQEVHKQAQQHLQQGSLLFATDEHVIDAPRSVYLAALHLLHADVRGLVAVARFLSNTPSHLTAVGGGREQTLVPSREQKMQEGRTRQCLTLKCTASLTTAPVGAGGGPPFR